MTFEHVFLLFLPPVFLVTGLLYLCLDWGLSVSNCLVICKCINQILRGLEKNILHVFLIYYVTDVLLHCTVLGDYFFSSSFVFLFSFSVLVVLCFGGGCGGGGGGGGVGMTVGRRYIYI